MAWGRYSGFFFYRYYSDGSKMAVGPYSSREEANAAKAHLGKECGKVFQKERPVMIW